ncbi:hypothetical protein [Microcystis phage Mwe-JY13]
MPDDSAGIYSVPAGTIVSTGDTILPSQHNPWANDSASAISARFSKDGRAPATGNWNLNGFRIMGLGAPVAGGDAVNKTYADGLNAVFSSKGHIFGLTLSNNVADPTNDIDVAVGEAASDGAIPYLMALAAPITKRLDAAWAVGSGNGGRDTGSIANTTYHVWLIQRSDTGVVDALFSTSATSPTMPTNYDRKRRIGAIIRTSGSIAGFFQVGDRFGLQVASLTFQSNSSRAAAPLALLVPTGVPLLADIAVAPVSTSGNVLIVSGNDFQCFSASTATYLRYEIQAQTDLSGQITVGTSGTPSGANPWQIYTKGWIDYTRSTP